MHIFPHFNITLGVPSPSVPSAGVSGAPPPPREASPKVSPPAVQFKKQVPKWSFSGEEAPSVPVDANLNVDANAGLKFGGDIQPPAVGVDVKIGADVSVCSENKPPPATPDAGISLNANATGLLPMTDVHAPKPRSASGAELKLGGGVGVGAELKLGEGTGLPPPKSNPPLAPKQ